MNHTSSSWHLHPFDGVDIAGTIADLERNTGKSNSKDGGTPQSSRLLEKLAGTDLGAIDAKPVQFVAMAMALALAAPMASMSSVHIGHVASANLKLCRGLSRAPASSSSPAIRRLQRNRSRNHYGEAVASASLTIFCEGFDVPASQTRNGTGHTSLSRHFVHVLRLVAAKVGQMGASVRDAVQQPQTQEEVQLLAALKGRMACAVTPILLAAISQSVNTPLTVVASGMAKWLELYSGVLMVRVLLSWFPNIPWERQPLQAMRDMCDPYLNLFRNIIPPLFNALDLSPMLAFLVLGVLTSVLNTTVQAT